MIWPRKRISNAIKDGFIKEDDEEDDDQHEMMKSVDPTHLYSKFTEKWQFSICLRKPSDPKVPTSKSAAIQPESGNACI